MATKPIFKGIKYKFLKFIFEDISMQWDFGRDLYNP
jgi:uncharacterized membrane protein YhdT